jgi:hypothetical protein
MTQTNGRLRRFGHGGKAGVLHMTLAADVAAIGGCSIQDVLFRESVGASDFRYYLPVLHQGQLGWGCNTGIGRSVSARTGRNTQNSSSSRLCIY